MTHETFRDLTADIAFPIRIDTRGGKSYTVLDAEGMWIPSVYPDTLIVARPKKGISFVAIEAIDSLHPELAVATR